MYPSIGWSRVFFGAFAVDCIALNYSGKIPIRGSNLVGKQPAAIDLPQQVHSTDNKLHYYYIGRSEL